MSGFATLVTRLRVLLGRARGVVGLELLRNRLGSTPADTTILLGGMRLRITDGPNTYIQYKDEFLRRNYAFGSASSAPVVIDGGANMGLFTLSTLRDHPGAHITAFEPDPRLLGLLRENLAANGATRVQLVNAALGAAEGTMGFAPDGKAGGALATGAAELTVNVVPLSRYLDGEVDFLKLNIEGAELDVLREAAAADRLRNVKAMVFEYHGWPEGEQRLGAILTLLDAQGFRYLIHDLDEQTNPVTKPPFRPTGASPWFALVYAWRIGAAGPR